MAKNLNRVLAFGIATAMVFGSSLTAFADAGTSGTQVTITGAGTEVNAKTDIFSVEVPTAAALSGTFKYVVDPEGVVAASKAAFGAEVTVNDNNGVLFKNVDGTSVSVSGTSDKLSIVNKSYKPVDLEVTFKLGAADGITLSKTEDFSGEGDSAKAMYFGLKATSEVDKAFTVIGSGDATSYKNFIKSDASEYEIKGTNNAGATTYAYALKDATNAKGQSYDLQVVAAINRNVPLSTWQTESDGNVSAKTMPEITVTFKPTQNKSAIGVAKWNSNWGIDLGLTADGGLLAAPTDVVWNGAAITGELTFKDGWASISWAQLIAAYNTKCGTTYTNSVYDDKLWNGTNVIQFKVGTQVYIAEIG